MLQDACYTCQTVPRALKDDYSRVSLSTFFGPWFVLWTVTSPLFDKTSVWICKCICHVAMTYVRSSYDSDNFVVFVKVLWRTARYYNQLPHTLAPSDLEFVTSRCQLPTSEGFWYSSDWLRTWQNSALRLCLPNLDTTRGKPRVRFTRSRGAKYRLRCGCVAYFLMINYILLVSRQGRFYIVVAMVIKLHNLGHQVKSVSRNGLQRWPQKSRPRL